jgi:hypothetical protein
MTEMAPGIAQDPEHAKALEAVAAAGRPTQGTWSTNYDPRTGIATQTNSRRARGPWCYLGVLGGPH